MLDTETTGLDYNDGHRIVEIGIIELQNHVPTGDNFHTYLNPERESDIKAEAVHGLTREFLSVMPKFYEIADDLIEFIADSKIIIHNAAFDIGFINSELRKCNLPEIDASVVIDTLELAKKEFLGQSVSLDSLCRKYNIDLSHRSLHGALKDAKLLASVYLELIGGQQSKLEFEDKNEILNETNNFDNVDINVLYKNLKLKKINAVKINEIDNVLHKKNISEIPNSIWKKLEI